MMERLIWSCCSGSSGFLVPYKPISPSPSVSIVMATAPTACRPARQEEPLGLHATPLWQAQQGGSGSAHRSGGGGATFQRAPAGPASHHTQHPPSGRSCPRLHRQRMGGWRSRAQSCWVRRQGPAAVGRSGGTARTSSTEGARRCRCRTSHAQQGRATAIGGLARCRLYLPSPPPCTALAMFSGTVMMVAAMPAKKSA